MLFLLTIPVFLLIAGATGMGANSIFQYAVYALTTVAALAASAWLTWQHALRRPRPSGGDGIGRYAVLGAIFFGYSALQVAIAVTLFWGGYWLLRIVIVAGDILLYILGGGTTF